MQQIDDPTSYEVTHGLPFETHPYNVSNNPFQQIKPTNQQNNQSCHSFRLESLQKDTDGCAASRKMSHAQRSEETFQTILFTTYNLQIHKTTRARWRVRSSAARWIIILHCTVETYWLFSPWNYSTIYIYILVNSEK